MTAECPYFTVGRPFPSLKIAPSHGRSGLPFNTWFPGPTQVLNPNGISIGSAIFTGLNSVTDRLTDFRFRFIFNDIVAQRLESQNLQQTEQKALK